MTVEASAPTSAPALEVRGLWKSFRVGHVLRRRRVVLRDLNLTVESGQVFGYLGPNGSGKTTTLKVLMGLVRPDRGVVHLLQRPLEDRTARQRIGFLPENPYFYDYLSAREYLHYAGHLCGMRARDLRERATALLELLGLVAAAEMPLRRFSKGMIQRLGMAQALINDPAMVFLDEPMSGLDPLGRHVVRDIILDLKREGRTVFFSTHILPDAEALCDRVALLRAGQVAAIGALEEILRIDVSHLEVLVSGIGDGARRSLPGGVREARALGERVRLEVPEGSLGEVVHAVEAEGGRVLSVQPVRQSLEDYFVKEMGGRQDAREMVE